MSNSLMHQLAVNRRHELLEEAARRRLGRDANPPSAHGPMPSAAWMHRLRRLARPAAVTSTTTSAGA
jgi:hypothetical protein